ncbi:MAG: hypothetical protein JW963_06435, partial [Anaerolineales bacterium]|nr:hypothetical protein [Anaerolineales bacterium]
AAYETSAEITLGWGMNLYPVEADRQLSAHGGISEYTVWRWRLYRHQLPNSVKLIVTEAARGDGSERANMGDISVFVMRVGNELDVVTFWYNAQQAGLGHWPLAVLWGRLEDLADAIKRELPNTNLFQIQPVFFSALNDFEIWIWGTDDSDVL